MIRALASNKTCTAKFYTSIFCFSVSFYYFLFSFSFAIDLLFECMQGRRSLGGDFTPVNDNINQITRLREHLRRLAEDHNLVPTEIEEETNQENQTMAAGGGKKLVMKEYARPIIGIAVSCIQLGEAARNYELKNINFTMFQSFYDIPNEDPLIFILDFYATVQTFPLQGLTGDQLRMRCFPYTLKDRAKAWLMTLPPNSLASWEAVYDKFMGKFYSHQKTTEL